MSKAKDPRGTFRRLLAYLRPFRLQLTLVIVFVVVSTLFSVISPYLVGVAIDQFIATGDAVGLLRIALLILGTYLAAALTSIGSGVVMTRVAPRVIRNLRQDLFDHLQTLSLSFFDRRPTGDLMSRLTNDLDAVSQTLSQNVIGFVGTLLSFIAVLVVMFRLNVWLTLGSLLLVPLMVGLTVYRGKLTRTRFRSLQHEVGRLNSTMEETLSGERVVIAFGQQTAAMASFDAVNLAVRDAGIRAWFYRWLIAPFMDTLTNADIAIVACLGGWLALNGLTSVGTIAAFISYTRQLSRPLGGFTNLYISLQTALAGAERVFDIIDTQPAIQDIADAIPLVAVEGEVRFNQVDFNYEPETAVLKDVSFHVKPGQTIALVGPTGAGKTTIVNVLTRFYDIQSGSISIDGHDVTNVKKDDLRKRLGIVLQDVYIFSGSVIDNIRYGRLDATDEECVEAAKLANAHPFIMHLPQGYQTLLSERGSNLSQGQRQLLSIARAVIANPDILILDEATSSVDSRTELLIQQALLKLMKGRTSFVIAHRLSTIRNADLILVVNEGRIIERGTHHELLRQKGFYYNLYMNQYKGIRQAQGMV